MVKNALLVTTVSLCMSVTTFLTPTSALAGNTFSRPANTPVISPAQTEISLEETLTYYGELMKQSRKSLLEELGKGIESIQYGMFYKYEFPSEVANICFFGISQDATPVGAVCAHPGLKRFTLSDVKKLLGEPTSKKIDDDKMLELGYNRVEDSEYLQSHVAFKFQSGILQKIAFVAT
jgi:hypothetical protein